MTHDTRRFETVAMPHLDAAYNLARWLTGDAHEANDVVQDAMLRAFRFFASFEGDDARAWLLKIVRNTYYSHWRRARAHGVPVEFEEELHAHGDPDSPLTLGHAAANPEDELSRRQQIVQLDAALARLPDEYREAIVLREIEDLSYKQIAETLGVPMGTVMSRISRARAMLSELVRKSNGIAGESVARGGMTLRRRAS